MKAQRTRKKINLPKLFFVDYVCAGTSSSLQFSYLVKIKHSKDILGSSKCKVTFGFKYRIGLVGQLLDFGTYMYLIRTKAAIYALADVLSGTGNKKR